MLSTHFLKTISLFGSILVELPIEKYVFKPGSSIYRLAKHKTNFQMFLNWLKQEFLILERNVLDEVRVFCIWKSKSILHTIYPERSDSFRIHFFTSKKNWQFLPLAPKKWSNQKIKAFSYNDNDGLFDLIKCLYFLIWPIFRS